MLVASPWHRPSSRNLVAQYSYFEQRELYDRLARRPYPWLVACAAEFATQASASLGKVIAPHEVLFDAPPQEREVELNVDVYFVKENSRKPALMSRRQCPIMPK